MINSLTRRKLISGLTLVAAHKEPKKGVVTLYWAGGDFPYHVATEGCVGQFTRFKDAHKEFLYRTGGSKARWTL